jgi:hypothetical protein
VRPRDVSIARRLADGLQSFEQRKRSLPGIRKSVARATFLEQLIESVHRVKYVSTISGRPLSDRRADPNDEMFHPLKAAILHQRCGDIDEAFWLVFIFVHFGKNAKGGWRYAREVYGALGAKRRWDWATVSANPDAFRAWLHLHQNDLKRKDMPGGFGNHRKYESLSAYSDKGTGAAVKSYVQWIGPPRTHQKVTEQAVADANGDPREAFDKLYRSMSAVARFGRTARFDYLTMVGKLGLAPIEPGSTYMQNSTGPIAGARLLFGANRKLSALELDAWLVELEVVLKVGMQVLEDSLCNWQKSPREFKPFRG